MIKAILFDGDGCVLKGHRYFSEIYSETYNISLEKITPFFKEKFGLCQTGKADLKIEIEPYLKDWGWQGTADDFLNFWFTSDVQPDVQTLKVVNSLREKGIKSCFATNQEKYRMEYIKNIPGFTQNFDAIFCSCDIGYRKPDQNFFRYILNSLDLKPEEALFWDSDQENVESAKTLGLYAERYISLEDFQEKLQKYLV